MNAVQSAMRKLPAKRPDGAVDLIEVDAIFYLEASEGDTFIRTRPKTPYRCVQRLHELAKRLPAPPFVQCHREYIVNLNRVRALFPRDTRD
jgi:DNA-binding LytR/AlgR family response regulator